ncbi:hypothetical protein PHMEG_00033970 [Phytophthora megakarya]|uniref:Uncharacterized protein n=1 Tax=Phytophthora megakarya TaxID=4795 RepID=A0A225US35_9STRA|nr:hypothetical protein PHMEG_00033970 [Phytophthora megakarya]
MFEEDTLRSIAQSRSAQRRRDHASPRRTVGGGGGDPGDDGSGDDGNDAPDPPANQPASNLPPPNPAMLPQDHLADNVCIPGRTQIRVFSAADTDPWLLDDLCQWSIMTMTVDLLAAALPFQPEWIYPHHTPRSRPPSDYCAHLITADNIEALIDESPWEILGGGNVPDPICFEILVGGRLGVFLDEYSQLELRDLIVYWESTHKLLITKRMCADHPRLAALCKARNNRRSHAGDRWRRILNHYHTSAADHPARQIPRLVEKLFGMESARRDSPYTCQS